MAETVQKRRRGTQRPTEGERAADCVEGESAAGVLMATPALLGLLAFVILPFVLAVGLSLFNVGLNLPRPPRFVGLRQYVRLFTDPDASGPFFRSMLNNLTFAVVVVPVQTALAVALAVMLNQKLRGIAFFRTFYFLPVIFPMALVAVIWRLFYERGPQGIFNSVLATISGGLIQPIDWLGSAATAMLSVILLSIWAGVGFQMVIILAGLQSIPEELFEAAALDRASAWQQFRYVTLPGLRNTLVFVVTLTTILSFQVFDQVYILIQTAGLNQNATRTILYQAAIAIFNENNIGKSAAITVVFFVMVVAITLIQRRFVRQDSEN